MLVILYCAALIITYFIIAYLARYLSRWLYQSNSEKYMIHRFVSFNMFYTLMSISLNWSLGIDSTALVLFIAAGVIIYLYADYLKEENQN